jgi:hypothetical protein
MTKIKKKIMYQNKKITKQKKVMKQKIMKMIMNKIISKQKKVMKQKIMKQNKNMKQKMIIISEAKEDD